MSTDTLTTFFTPDELVKILRDTVTVRTIQRWCRERRIPYVKIGRDLLFTAEQVAEIAEAYTVEPEQIVEEHVLPNPAYNARQAVVVPMRRPGDAA